MTAPAPDADEHVVPFGDDGLAPARGCLTGLALGLAIWALVAITVAVLW